LFCFSLLVFEILSIFLLEVKPCTYITFHLFRCHSLVEQQVNPSRHLVEQLVLDVGTHAWFLRYVIWYFKPCPSAFAGCVHRMINVISKPSNSELQLLKLLLSNEIKLSKYIVVLKKIKCSPHTSKVIEPTLFISWLVVVLVCGFFILLHYQVRPTLTCTYYWQLLDILNIWSLVSV